MALSNARIQAEIFNYIRARNQNIKVGDVAFRLVALRNHLDSNFGVSPKDFFDVLEGMGDLFSNDGPQDDLLKITAAGMARL